MTTFTIIRQTNHKRRPHIFVKLTDLFYSRVSNESTGTLENPPENPSGTQFCLRYFQMQLTILGCGTFIPLTPKYRKT